MDTPGSDELTPAPSTPGRNGGLPVLVRADGEETAEDVVRRLDFPLDGPVLVVLGGANSMDEPSLEACEPLFNLVLAPIAARTGAVVVDGGTDAGVMRLMGRARAASHPTFPLVGVAPVGRIATPGAGGSDRAQPEPNHSHLVLVPGDSFGDESPWLADIASALAGGAMFPALMVNGGEVSLQDGLNVVRAGGYVVAVEGSGRTADRLAAAASGSPVSSSDEAIRELIASGRVFAERLHSDRLAERLNVALSGEGERWPS